MSAARSLENAAQESGNCNLVGIFLQQETLIDQVDCRQFHRLHKTGVVAVSLLERATRVVSQNAFRGRRREWKVRAGEYAQVRPAVRRRPNIPAVARSI
jgi:hypothetical protein